MHGKFALFIIVTLAACLSQFASDIYAPSVPAIAVALKTDISLVQLSMSIYMLGVALSQIVYGALSNGIGRKTIMSIGLCIMAIGSIGCWLSHSIYLLIAMRFLQGCGAGACAALWRAIFRDVFTGKELAKYGSYAAIMITFIVPLAPAIGGYLQHYFSWQANFVFMASYALIVFAILVLKMPETHLEISKHSLNFKFITNAYKELLCSRIFMGITCCIFLAYGALFSSMIVLPVLLIKELGMTPVAFGWFSFLGIGFAYGLSGWLNGKLVSRYGMVNMMRFGYCMMLLSSIMLFGGYLLFKVHLFSILLAVIVFYFGATFIWPNAFAIAFTPFGKIAGFAGALYGFMQIGGGAVIGSITSYVPDKTQVPLATIILILSLASWAILEKLKIPHELEES